MAWTGSRVLAAVVIVAVVVLGCRSVEDSEREVAEVEEPALPAGYRKIPPGSYDTSDQILRQTGAIVRGTLEDVHFEFDKCGGPRTVYRFTDASSIVGTAVNRELTVKALGGVLPNGNWLSVSTVPRLALDSEYVLFLRNTDWTFSPVLANMAYRREVVGGRELLVDALGRAVTGWGDGGATVSTAVISEPVGRQRHGYRRSVRENASSPTAPDPQASVTRGRAPEQSPIAAAGKRPAYAYSPSPEEIRTSGMFARPAVSVENLPNVQAASTDSLVSSATEYAQRAGVQIGGRLTLEPLWRCWSSTNTSKARR
jgi:hypothetical protein